MTRRAYLTTRVTAKVLKAIQRIAALERRTVSQVAAFLIEEGLKKRRTK